jgi:glycosyltransferase involved in cell wall biosynthesis
MRLLVFTNKFDRDDDLLGFFVSWVGTLSKILEKVIVVTQEVGEYDNLANVSVINLDKANNPGKMSRVFNFYRQAREHKDEFDAILIMMAPSWAIFSWPLKVILKKKLYLWYAVWKGDSRLFIAEKLVDNIFSSIPEAFPFPTPKLKVIGQGIDTDFFIPNENLRKPGRIIFLGRISPVKKLELLIRAISEIKVKYPEVYDYLTLEIIGGIASENDRTYLNGLKQSVEEMQLSEKITWVGRVAHTEAVNYFQSADIFVNMTPTGSFDKSMLEAMACGDIIIASNTGLAPLLGAELEKICMFKEGDKDDLTEKLVSILKSSNRNMYREELRNIIILNHSQSQWARNLAQNL